MTQGIKSLRQIQLNREDVQGAATTDYTPWRGTGTLEDARVVVMPDEDIGIFGGTTRQYFPKLSSVLELDDIELIDRYRENLNITELTAEEIPDKKCIV